MSPKVQRLVKLLSRLPGVGEKTAQRYVLWLLTADEALARDLGAELAALRDELGPCERCGNVAEIARVGARCARCARTASATQGAVRRRARARPHGDRAGRRRCAGATSCSASCCRPLEGIGPEELPLGQLAARIRADGVTEVIVATPPSVDGEATALLLKRELAPLGVAVTRIASGVPHGGDLEFADPITMGRALAAATA